jgi:hypothetical protein
LKQKGVTQESVTKVGVDDLGNSTTLESNTSLRSNRRRPLSMGE